VSTVAVLGPGAVGGMVATRVAAAGGRVVCVGTQVTVAAIGERGLVLETPDGVLQARPEAVERLTEPVSLLVVAVKAPALPEALERIEVFAVADGVVVPLLNGLEHPEVVRRRLGPRVAPGSISRFQARLDAPARIVQETGTPRVTAAPGDVGRAQLERALEPLRVAGIEIVIESDERAVLWEKVARLAPLAAATAASGLTVGGIRAAPAWRGRLEAAVAEACAVAAADGVSLTPESQLTIIDAMADTLTTSAARDVAAGRRSELDAIVGSVLRVARRHGLEAPALAALLQEAEAA
jgi:2-dehydropantoate 2-reductase